MRENLILKQFKKERVFGTYNLKDDKTFFGSKMLILEKDIIIDDKSVLYYQVYNEYDSSKTEIENNELMKNNGYQYYNLNYVDEKMFILDCVDLKYNNHTIKNIDDKSLKNARWEISINVKNILFEYLFAKIKESRVFKLFSYEYFLNNNINESIYEYIRMNVLNKYKLDKIYFYIEYVNLKNIETFEINDMMYNNIFDLNAKKDENLVSNINIKLKNDYDMLSDVVIIYNQLKSVSEYRFNYYFDVYYKLI